MNKHELILERLWAYNPSFLEYMKTISKKSKTDDLEKEIQIFAGYFRWHWIYWMVSSDKNFWLERLSVANQWMGSISMKPKHAFDTLIGKNIDYGSEQLLLCGVKGIAARITDKLCRLKWLKQRKGSILGEPYDDAILDWFNYCILALLLIDKKLI